MTMIFQGIKQFVLINDVWPAIILEDYSIRIMIKNGTYWTHEQYVKQKENGLPYEDRMFKIIEEAYAHDWKSEFIKSA